MSLLLGPAFKIGSTLAFAGMLVTVKELGTRFPPGEVVFFRSAFALAPVFAMVWWQGQLADGLRTARPWGHLVRSVVGVTAMALWFTGVQRLPLADGLAITYAAPLVTVALAALLLGETVGGVRWAAVLVGFLGVGVVLSPHLGDVAHVAEGGAALGALACFGSAFFMALAQIQVSRLTETEKTGAIVVWFSIGSALCALATAPFGWVMPSAEDAALLVATGLFGGVGQILMTQSFRHADASVVAPLEYASMIWAVATGWWFFGDVPSLVVLAGTAVVVASGVAVVWSARRA